MGEVTESGKMAFQLNLIGPGVNLGMCLEKQGISLGMGQGQTLGMCTGQHGRTQTLWASPGHFSNGVHKLTVAGAG